MNVLKSFAQEDQIDYFLTYADNHAVEYFKKQGFTKNLRIPDDQYKGYIKDYYGGTLMDCYINKKIDFRNISKIIKDHKELLVQVVSKVAHKKVYPGLDFSKVAPGEMIDFENIPGLSEAGWSKEDYLKNVPAEMTFDEQCKFILNKLK